MSQVDGQSALACEFHQPSSADGMYQL